MKPEFIYTDRQGQSWPLVNCAVSEMPGFVLGECAQTGKKFRVHKERLTLPPPTHEKGNSDGNGS